MADWIGVDVANATCSIDGCDRPHKARGWCAMHHNRWLRSGDTGLAGTGRPTLWGMVDKNGPKGCWLWLGFLKRGYGVVRRDGRKWAAHRFFYELLVGPIPDGLVIDHLCRVRNCVNPQHLEPVTNAENLARGEGPNAKALRDNTCIRGHEFTPENTYYRPSRPRVRICKSCQRDRQAGPRRTA